MLALGRLIGKRYYIYVWLTLAAVWFYTALSGASPSVMRSAVMASLFLIAELLGGQRNAGPALCLAAAVMIAFNPLVLWDVSFQLSVLSMAGIIFVYPLLLGAVERRTARPGEEGNRPRLHFVLEQLRHDAGGHAGSCSACLGGLLRHGFSGGTLRHTAGAAVTAFHHGAGRAHGGGGAGLFPTGAGIRRGGVAVHQLPAVRGAGFRRASGGLAGHGQPATAIVVAYYALMALLIVWLVRRRRRKFMAEMAVV